MGPFYGKIAVPSVTRCHCCRRRRHCCGHRCASLDIDAHDAMLSAVYAVVVCLRVCVSVGLSVTLQYCIKTAKHRITQITPHDSPVTVVFWCQRSWRNSNGITPYGDDKCKWGGLKSATFDGKHTITRKWYKIDA